MGRAVKIKSQRREMRRELERQLRDPRRHREVEEAMAAMRTECYYILARLEVYLFKKQRIDYIAVARQRLREAYFQLKSSNSPNLKTVVQSELIRSFEEAYYAPHLQRERPLWFHR